MSIIRTTLLSVIIGFVAIERVAYVLHSMRGPSESLLTDRVNPRKVIMRIPEMKLIEPGVTFAIVTISKPNGSKSQLYVYLPSKPKREHLPCIFIAAAGSPLCTGVDLSPNDMKEHIPYVKAGFAVVAYSVDGAYTKKGGLKKAQAEFLESEAGLANYQAATHFAETQLHADAEQFIVAGHSSAGTLALELAGDRPEIKACIAYAPATDLMVHLSKSISSLEKMRPGAATYYKFLSPRSNIGGIDCPLFLFHSAGDKFISQDEFRAYAKAEQAIGAKVSVVETKIGDHYNSMLTTGIPAALKWLDQQHFTPR